MADAGSVAAATGGANVGGPARGAAGLPGHPAPHRGRTPHRALWFGLFAAPTAWSVQTIANYSLAAHSCFPALYPLGEPTVGGLRGIVFAVSMAAVTVCLAALAVAWRAWRHTRVEEQESSGTGAAEGEVAALVETGSGRTRFMAMGGVLMSAVFLIASVAHLATVFLVSPCAGGG